MNRINAIMVYAVIIIWTGIILLYGVSGAGKSHGQSDNGISRRPPVSQHLRQIPAYDPRLASWTPLYY